MSINERLAGRQLALREIAEKTDWEDITAELLQKKLPDEGFPGCTYLVLAAQFAKLHRVPQGELSAVPINKEGWEYVKSLIVNLNGPGNDILRYAIQGHQLEYIPEKVQIALYGDGVWTKRDLAGWTASAFMEACMNGEIVKAAPEVIRKMTVDANGWQETDKCKEFEKSRIQAFCDSGRFAEILRPEIWDGHWKELAAFIRILPGDDYKDQAAGFQATLLARHFANRREDRA